MFRKFFKIIIFQRNYYSNAGRNPHARSNFQLDRKTVRIFAYSSKREQSHERSGTRLKTESETGERR